MSDTVIDRLMQRTAWDAIGKMNEQVDQDRNEIVCASLGYLGMQLGLYNGKAESYRTLIDALVRFGATRDDFASYGLDDEWPGDQ